MTDAIKKQLTDLVNNSQTLDDRRKKMILENLDHLSDDQAQKLIAVFKKVQDKLKQIEEKYQDDALELKKEYIKTANEFTDKDLTEIFKHLEKVHKKNAEAEMDELLKKL